MAVEHELRELAELERECCAFATWTVWNEDAQSGLDVEAEGLALEAVHAMFEGFESTLSGTA